MSRHLAARRSHRRLALAAAVSTVLGVGALAPAAVLTWDANLSTTGPQDGSGTWTTGGGGWWSGSANVNWAAGDQAIFGAGTDGTYAITIGGAITTANGTSLTGALNFVNSGYTLSATSLQTITLGNATGTAVIRVASGKTATVGNNVRIQKSTHTSAQLALLGGGTLEIASGGILNNTNNNANEVANGSTLRINGGTVTLQTSLVVGQLTSGWGTSGTLIVDAGSLTITTNNLNVGRSNGDVSVATLNGGSINVVAGNLNFGATATSTSTFNLNGGTLSVRQITDTNTTSLFNFNGGTLRASSGALTAFMTGLDRANVRNGGAIIDTNGQNLTIGQPLLHSDISGDDAIDGGLTLNDTAVTKGTLTLTATNTYTGTTTINAGTLALGASNVIASGAVTVDGSSAVFSIGANSDTVGAVTLKNGGSITGSTGVLTGTSYAVESGSVSAILGGSSVALTKSTSGTVTLSGANTYTGATSINAGRLDVTGSLTSDVTVAAGAALGGDGSTTGSLTFSAGNSTLFFDPTGVVTNAFTANTISVAGATILVTASGATDIGTTYTVLKQTGGSFSGSPTDNFVAASRGTLAFANTNTELTLTPTAAQSITWKGNDGTNPTYWDVVNTVNWDNAGSGDRFYAGDTVNFDDTASTYTVAIQGSSVSPAAVNFTNATNDYSVSGGAIAGSATLTKSGAATVNLAGAHTYSGTTTVNGGTLNVTGSILNSSVQINGGTLQVSNGNAISNTGVVSIANAAGATFRVSTSETIGALSGGGGTGGNVTIDAGQTLTLSSGTQTYSGTISGAGTLTSSGAVQTLNGAISTSGGVNLTSGRLFLGGNSSYTGQTTVSAGAGIVVTANNALGAAGAGNETVILGGGGANSGAIGLSGGITYSTNEKIIGAGVGNTTANGEFASVQRGIVQSVSGNNTFAGNIEINASNVTRFGTQNGASLTLSGTISRSTGVTGVIVIFRPGSSGGEWITLTGSGNEWDSETRIFTDATTSAGVRLGVDNGLSTTAFLNAGGDSAGTGNSFDLNGYNQTLGGLTSNGRLRIVNSSATLSTLTLNTSSNQSNRNDTTNLTLIEDGTGTGKVALVKKGTATQTLNGVHTYSGTTTIEAGTLALSGSVAKPVSINNTPTIDVWSGATFNVSDVTGGYTLGATQTIKGNGTVVGAMTVAGTIAPGASVGTLKTGNITLSGTYEAEIDWTDFNSPNADLIEVTGTVNVSGGTLTMVMLNVAEGGATFSPDKVVVLVKNDGTDAVTGTFATITPPPYLTLQYTVLYDYNADGGTVGNDIAVSFSGVPEPGSLSLLGLGALGLRRRRQR